MSIGGGNTYLDQVVAQQAQLEQDLHAKRSAPAPQIAAPAPPGAPPAPAKRAREPAPPVEAARAAPGGVEVRVTGWWRWKTVLVPPNAFVVHTRRGRAEPLHVGQGTSFRYHPATDAFLAVPGAMQTIL